MTSTFEFRDIFEKLHDALGGVEGTNSYDVNTNFNETAIEVTVKDWESSGYTRYQDSPAITIRHLLGKTWAVLKHKAYVYAEEENNVDLLGQSNYVISWNTSDADANDIIIEELVDEVHRYMVPPENENPASDLDHYENPPSTFNQYENPELHQCVMLISQRVKRLERRLQQ